MSNLANNTFEEGLVMDSSTLNTPSNVLTNCLNGTLLTRNGNEYVLQNDMGNGRVETARLPEGFIPLGTCSLGGIIYIVSYNPLTNLSQIGSFPSPERNITSDELGEEIKSFSGDSFYKTSEVILFPRQKLILLDKELNPGDKFQIFDNNSLIADLGDSGRSLYEIISAYKVYDANDDSNDANDDNPNENDSPIYLKIRVVVVQDNGTVKDITNSLVWNDGYYIYKGKITKDENGKLNVTEYRNTIDSNYNVLQESSGKIGLLFELEAINSFDVSWDALKNANDKWNIYLFTNWTYNNNYLPSKNKINLYNIGYSLDGEKTIHPIKITNYPTSYLKSEGDTTTDILLHKDGVFYNPILLDNIDEIHNKKEEEEKEEEEKENVSNKAPLYDEKNKILRKNNGTDNLFLITKPIELSNKSGIVNFDIYPGMPYGYLEYLKLSFSINIDKLGTGIIDLKEFRYYYENEKITLNWGLEAYPERSKKIKDITFEFYEYNSDYKDFVIRNASFIDDYKFIIAKKKLITPDNKYKWVNSSGNAIVLNDPSGILQNPIEKQIPSKSSYSGNFVETLNLKELGLNDNSLYIVKIIIDYNGEEDIIYYRFLYTNNIFNKYYFNCNDYKEIILDDAIDNNFYLEKIEADDTRYNLDIYLNKEKLEYIPNFKEEISFDEYYIESQYTCNLKRQMKGDSNTIFDIGVTDIELNDSVARPILKNDNKLSLVQGNFISDLDKLPDLYIRPFSIIKPNGDNISAYLSVNSTTPIKIEYEKQGSKNVSYELSKLKIKTNWLVAHSDKKKMLLYCNDYYDNPDDISNSIDTFGDKTFTVGTISKYPNVRDHLLLLLKENDIIVLQFRLYHDNKGGEAPNVTWGYGKTRKTRREKFYDNNIFWDNTGNEENDPVFIIYAIQDDSGEIRLFTYTIDAKISLKEKIESGEELKFNATLSLENWNELPIKKDYAKINSFIGYRWNWSLFPDIPGFPRDPNTPNPDEINEDNIEYLDENTWYKHNKIPFAVTHKDITDKNLKKPFEDYLKIVNISEYIPVNEWSALYYYNDYTWQYTVDLNCEISYNFKFKDKEFGIDPSTEEGKQFPNNLTYYGVNEKIIPLTISNKEKSSNYVNTIFLNIDGFYYVKYNGVPIKIPNFDEHSLYIMLNGYPKPISLIIENNGIIESDKEEGKEEKSNDPLSFSKYALTTLNNFVKLINNSINSDDFILGVASNSDDEGVLITNILSINDNLLNNTENEQSS